jgi:hypothetical protein
LVLLNATYLVAAVAAVVVVQIDLHQLQKNLVRKERKKEREREREGKEEFSLFIRADCCDTAPGANNPPPPVAPVPNIKNTKRLGDGR